MCGISGEIRFDDSMADIAAVSRMTDALAARGPDGAGVLARDRVALGHRRLRRDERGRQIPVRRDAEHGSRARD